MARVLRRDAAEAQFETYDEGQALLDLKSFLLLKDRIAEQTKLMNTFKSTLSQYLEENGEPDDKGHLWITLPDGSTLKRERRISETLDEDYAITWLENEKMFECLGQITVVDDDALAAAVYANQIPADILRRMYPKKETFAFVPKGPA